MKRTPSDPEKAGDEMLAAEDMLSMEEADYLNNLLTPMNYREG